MPTPVLILNNLIELWKTDEAAFNQMPEFGFIVPLAKEIKLKGCTCGLGAKVAEVTQAFNVVVQGLSPESVVRLKTVLARDPLVFGLQSAAGFETVSY